MPPESDRIVAAEAYALLGLPSEQALNHARRELQRVLGDDGRVLPYPDFATEVGWIRHLSRRQAEAKKIASTRGETEARAFLDAQQQLVREVRLLEIEFDAAHVLVVPQWGGKKWPKNAWTYSRRLCAGDSVA